MMLLNVGLMYITEGRKALGSMMAGRPRSIFAMDNSCVAPLTEWALTCECDSPTYSVSTIRRTDALAWQRDAGCSQVKLTYVFR